MKRILALYLAVVFDMRCTEGELHIDMDPPAVQTVTVVKEKSKTSRLSSPFQPESSQEFEDSPLEDQKKRVPLLRNLLHSRQRRACLNRRAPMTRLRNRSFRALLPVKSPWPLPLPWHGWSNMDMVISNRKETI